MNQHRLLFELERVAARFRLLRFWQALAAAWLVAALGGLVLWTLKSNTGSDLGPAVPLLAVVAFVMSLVGAWVAVARAGDPSWVARKVEAAFPELRTCLLAAVEQQPDLPGGRFGYLQSNVIHQALLHADRHEWRQVVPTHHIAAAIAANFATFVLFAIALLAAALWVVPASTAAALAALPNFSGAAGFAFSVEPGSVEVERGSSLLVLARVQGRMPPEAALIFEPEAGDETRLAMSSSLDDPIFGGRIPIVDAPLDYRVEIGDQISPVYHVKVFEYPRLERADAHLVYPSYTNQDPRVVQDVRTISVVEGTELKLVCYLNKAVKSATLTEDKFPAIALVPAKDSAGQTGPAYEMTIRCEATRRLKLELIDNAGRKNVKPSQFTINVLPNQPVTLKPIFPARDTEVSALEELEIKATAWDDFGIQRVGVSYALAGQSPVDVVLSEKAAARQKHELTHVIRLEELKAQEDDLLSYHFWAEDFAADGTLRRSESDMYFAEVRPFDEIFRQGEPPPGGESQQRQSGNAQQAQQLSDLQKQIINATWKVIRRETRKELSASFASDAEQIWLSQDEAQKQATALAEKLQDGESREHAVAVLEAMAKAVEELKAAHDGPATAPLMPALKAEQAAYQGLLKLRAREHSIVRQSQRQRSSRGSASRSQQQRMQMQNLDLKNEENRYETERQAQDQQDSAEERENRQVLNRLKELAQRQHDLNDRLKEMQSALEEARTAEQREELRRQLQRLQDEQRQILQDTEELQSRLESPENLERMSAEREQLQQTREQVQRASEALEESKVSQAAAAGTRAQENFKELRNEFRRRASGRFNEEMQQMRDAARDLDQKQQELGQRLTESAQPSTAAKSLRDTGEREKIAEQMTQQRERLGGLQEKMRGTIQEAEETEPLLAERLHDALRGVQEQNLERVLEGAERSLRQGLVQDAQRLEEPATRGIGQLREGIEKAAEAVLGDETEALRRAREELQELARELNEEINRNAPAQPGRPGQAQTGRTAQAGENEEGQPQPGQQSGEKSQGEAQPNEQPGDGSGKSQQGDDKKSRGQKAGQKGQGTQADGGMPSAEPQEGQQGKKGSGQKGQSPQGKGGKGKGGAQQPGNRNQKGARSLGGENGGGNAGPFEGGREAGPLAGEGFREWSDRLRDVEEMVGDPDLRAEAARIRDQARAARAESKRHSVQPNWELVQSQIAGPLMELRDRVAQELLRRTAKEAIVPLDRDPVPPKYAEKTRLYYERLGSGSTGTKRSDK